MVWVVDIKVMDVLEADKKCLPTTYKVDTCVDPKPFNAGVLCRSPPQKGGSVGAMVFNHPNSDIDIFTATVPTNA